MIPLGEVIHNLKGAGRLALRDPAGLSWFETTPRGFYRSFWAAVVILPLYVVMLASEYARLDPSPPFGGFVLVQAIAYVIGWTLFPVVMLHVAGWLGRANRYIALVVATNWSNVIQMAVVMTVAGLGSAGAAPGGLAALFAFMALVWALSYQFFVVKVALDVSGFVAALIVIGNLIAGLIVEGTAAAIMR